MEKTPISWPGWHTEEQIGRGGFGTVYRLRRRDDFGLQEDAALKYLPIPQDEGEIRELRMSGMDDQSISTQFREQVQSIVGEYKIMMGLKNCPNIVHCHDFRVLEQGMGYTILLKMELLTPLVDVIRRGGMTTEKEVIRLGSHICNALAVCQEKNILHRDVKPQNIFLAEDGNFKLGDFGIARTMDKDGHATTIGVGTYSYMAPEVFSRQRYDARADIYSLGLVLYGLLNNHRGPFLPPVPEPITAQARENARHMRIQGRPLPPPLHGSRELFAIICKACAHDPNLRYPTAAAMKRDLDALARGDLAALSLMQPQQSGDQAKQKRKPGIKAWVLGSLVAAAAALCCLLVVLLAAPGQEESSLQTQPRQTQSAQTEAPVVTEAKAAALAAPELSIQPGTYDQLLSLEISCQDPEAEIYVTLRSTTAQGQEGMSFYDVKYSGPIALGRGASTVIAYARKGEQTSEMVTGEYTILFQEEEVFFQDPYVEAMVRAQIEKPAGKVTNFDCEQVTLLSGYDVDGQERSELELTTLEDLKYLPNLQYLFLPDDRLVEDWSPLAYCTQLESLDINMDGFTDLDILKYTPYLTTLTLMHDSIQDVSGLEYLKNLEQLVVFWEHISLDWMFAQYPNLKQVSSLSFYAHLVNDYGLLEQLPNLERLNISNVTRIHLEGIGKLTNVIDLDLTSNYRNPIQDLSFLEGMTQLERLSLFGFEPTQEELLHLYPLTNLLDLWMSELKDMDPAAVEELQKALPNCKIGY